MRTLRNTELCRWRRKVEVRSRHAFVCWKFIVILRQTQRCKNPSASLSRELVKMEFSGCEAVPKNTTRWPNEKCLSTSRRSTLRRRILLASEVPTGTDPCLPGCLPPNSPFSLIKIVGSGLHKSAAMYTTVVVAGASGGGVQFSFRELVCNSAAPIALVPAAAGPRFGSQPWRFARRKVCAYRNARSCEKIGQ